MIALFCTTTLPPTRPDLGGKGGIKSNLNCGTVFYLFPWIDTFLSVIALFFSFGHYSEILGIFLGFPGGSEGKAPTRNAGDPGSIPGSGSSPGEGNGNPLQYSCLENPMDQRAWRATVHGVAKSRT